MIIRHRNDNPFFLAIVCVFLLSMAGLNACAKAEPALTPSPSQPEAVEEEATETVPPSQPKTSFVGKEEASPALKGLKAGWVQSTIYEHPLISPSHLTVDSEGTVLVNCRVHKTVLRLTTENKLALYADLSSIPGKIDGMAFQPSHGRLLLVTDNGELYAYSDGKLTRLQPSGSVLAWAMAVRSDGSFYGATRHYVGSIRLYDANGNLMEMVVPGARGVFQMALNKANNKLYYSETFAGDIVEKDLISGESRVLISGVGIPDTYEPIAVAVDDNDQLWFHTVRQGLHKCENGRFVKIMDTRSAAGELIWSSSHGAFLQAIEANANIFSYNPANLTATNLTQAVNAFGAVEMDDGTVLVINYAFPQEAIYKVDANGFTPFSDKIEGGCSALARDVHGNVYCASFKEGSIYKVAADGSLTPWAVSFSPDHVCSLAFDSKNDALIAITGTDPGYFPNSSTASVWRIPVEAPDMPVKLTDLTGVTVSLNQPLATADKSGNIFILEYNNDAIFKIPDGSTEVTTFITPVLGNPAQCAPSFAYLSYEDALLVGTIFHFELWPLDNPVKSLFSVNNGAVDNWVISETRDGGFVAAHSGRVFRLTQTDN